MSTALDASTGYYTAWFGSNLAVNVGQQYYLAFYVCREIQHSRQL
ncbi:MAG: hypothetical protein ABJB66_00600 [Gemmatimonadaceae bacterium]